MVGGVINMAEKEWEKQEGANIWLPTEEDDKIEGEVVEIVEGTYGNQYVIKEEDGDQVRTPSHKVLQTRMIKAKVGDVVRIVYKGEEPPSVKGQNPTRMYEVFIKKA